jgi:hypothetical protein
MEVRQEMKKEGKSKPNFPETPFTVLMKKTRNRTCQSGNKKIKK